MRVVFAQLCELAQHAATTTSSPSAPSSDARGRPPSARVREEMPLVAPDRGARRRAAAAAAAGISSGARLSPSPAAARSHSCGRAASSISSADAPGCRPATRHTPPVIGRWGPGSPRHARTSTGHFFDQRALLRAPQLDHVHPHLPRVAPSRRRARRLARAPRLPRMSPTRKSRPQPP